MYTTTCGIAEAKIGSTEDKGTPNLFNSLNKTILLDNTGQEKIRCLKITNNHLLNMPRLFSYLYLTTVNHV